MTHDIKTGQGHYIGGAWAAGSGAEIVSTDPTDGTILWQGTEATQSHVDAAVAAARDAAPSWQSLAVEERIGYVEKYRALLEDRAESMANVISAETGKPLWETRGEVGAMVAKVAISVAAHQDRCPTRVKETGSTASVTRHKPHGVAAVFGPFNFPGHLPNGHIVPALIAGNTVVLKPSEVTPLVAEKMVALWEEAALPKGVLNLVQGGAATGKALAQHPDIDALFFTGSYRTGRILSEQFGKTPEKLLALELGGNNPLVIGAINDIKAAAYHTILSAYVTAGQRCTCARRLIVPHDTQGDAFLAHLSAMIKGIAIGKWDTDPQPFMGCVINEESASHIYQTYEQLVSAGGNPLVSMERLPLGIAFLSPALVDVTGIAHRSDNECFGPLLQVVRVGSFEEAIAEANDTAYGLSAGIFTEDEAQYRTFYANIRAGIVNWNTQLTGASSAAPFGGIGNSGNHRPSAYYAADYCSYPVASMEATTLSIPEKLSPGLTLH